MFRISALWVVPLVALLVVGCATKPPQPLQVCPGKANATEALQTLALHAEQAVSLRASGDATLTYHEPDKKKPERQNLFVQLRFDPPTRIFLQGGTTVAPKAVIMGANQNEFWLTLKPKEISSYYIGEWRDVRDFAGLMMSPRIVLESIGILTIPGTVIDPARWTLRNQGPLDILTQHDVQGRPVKRLSVYACDYTVRKIEYFDRSGKVTAVADLGEYETVEGFSIPTRIDIVSTGPQGQKDSVAMHLGPVRTTQYNERQLQGLFNPPPFDGFEHIYHYENDQWVPSS